LAKGKCLKQANFQLPKATNDNETPISKI
jgi:hypothetical protein